MGPRSFISRPTPGTPASVYRRESFAGRRCCAGDSRQTVHSQRVSGCLSIRRCSGGDLQRSSTSGSARLIIQRVKFDHVDWRVTRGVEGLAQQAVERLRDRVTVYNSRSTLSEPLVDRAGDLMLMGVAEAWDPGSPDRYRAFVTLYRRARTGGADTLGQFIIGALGSSDGFTIDPLTSKDEEDPLLVRPENLRTAVGQTTLEGCVEFPRNCYRDEARAPCSPGR